MVLSNSDDIYLAWSEEFLIKKYSPDGEYIEAFYYPYLRTPFEPEALFPEADEGIINEAIQSMELSQESPALNEMIIDDENRLWVSTIGDDTEIYTWWVLNDIGELITKFTWPSDESVEIVKNGKMYTRKTDEETGLQQIVRYGIEIKEILSEFSK